MLTPGSHSSRLVPRASARRVRTYSLGALNTLRASAPGTYKERLWGCLASLNPGAGLAAAPRSPPCGNLPTTPHPDGRLLHLGSPLHPQVVNQVQDSLALPPGISSLKGLTIKEIIVVLFCSSISVYLIVTLACW